MIERVRLSNDYFAFPSLLKYASLCPSKSAALLSLTWEKSSLNYIQLFIHKVHLSLSSNLVLHININIQLMVTVVKKLSLLSHERFDFNAKIKKSLCVKKKKRMKNKALSTGFNSASWRRELRWIIKSKRSGLCV